PALSELGLAALHGSSPDVGIAGYSLGGGIGWLARKHGMQANAVTALELVTADGQLRRVDHDQEPDLFWALRGGNGNFGVVTAVEFSVVAVERLLAGALFYPIEQIHDVLGTWVSLLPTFPEEMTTWVSVIHFPADPAVPEFVRGQSRAVLMAAHLGDERQGRDLLAPFQRLNPIADTLVMQTPVGLAELAMDPVDPLPYRSTTALLDRLTETAVADLARVSGTGSPLALLQIRHGGGALSRREQGAGARATLPGQIILYSLGVVTDASSDDAVTAALREVSSAVQAAKVGDYPNFVERPADAESFFDAETWRRLQNIKHEYDPSDLFLGNHHISGRG
ncbi:MAG TPA: FAD-binding protein, partial [Actinomycetes bacterium]|nr:FAD-binding protein [Actinomycetes bacterium]